MSLPSGYKRLEYIQSSGTQYIDTGFKPNQDTRVVMEIDPSDNGVDDWFFDGRNGGNNKSFGVYCQYALSAKPWYSDYGTSRLKVTGPSSTGRVTIDKKQKRLYDWRIFGHASGTDIPKRLQYVSAVPELGRKQERLCVRKAVFLQDL